MQFSPGAKIKDGYVAEKMSPESPELKAHFQFCVWANSAEKKNKRKKFALIALAAPGF